MRSTTVRSARPDVTSGSSGTRPACFRRFAQRVVRVLQSVATGVSVWLGQPAGGGGTNGGNGGESDRPPLGDTLIGGGRTQARGAAPHGPGPPGRRGVPTPPHLANRRGAA